MESPGCRGEAPRLVLGASGFDPDRIAAEGGDRRDGPHPGQSGQLEAQPLEGADERALIHYRLPEHGEGGVLGRVAHRHVFRPEEHLHPAGHAHAIRAIRTLRRLHVGAQRKVHRPHSHTASRSLPHQQVGGAQEGGHELRLRSQVELLRRPRLQQTAEGEHRQPVRELEGLFLVVGDEQGGDPQLALDLADGPPQIRPHLGVEGAERLVEQQHLRLVGEGSGEGDPLLLSTGELARHAAAETGEPHQFQQLVAPPPP